MKETGGPAFPTPEQTRSHFEPGMGAGMMTIMGGPGMTLRDYFAAKAMVGIISVAPDYSLVREGDEDATLAKNAYDIADAMLAERAK